MASSLSAAAAPPPLLTLSPAKSPHLKPSSNQISPSLFSSKVFLPKSNLSSSSLTFLSSHHLGHLSSPAPRASSGGSLDSIQAEIDTSSPFEERPVKFLFWVLLWASVSLAWFAASGDSKAAATASGDSIRASSFGLKIANALRSSGWPDEGVVFALATLPIIELRGAIPVGYWLQLRPTLLTVLSVLGLRRIICRLRTIRWKQTS